MVASRQAITSLPAVTPMESKPSRRSRAGNRFCVHAAGAGSAPRRDGHGRGRV